MLSATGATLACGTGACAVVVAAVLEGRADRVSSKLLHSNSYDVILILHMIEYMKLRCSNKLKTK